MGRIYKRGGTYYADFVDKRRRRVQRSLRTDDRAVAKARLRDLELATTDSGAHATEVMSDALDYFTDTVCASKPEATRSSYQQKARHLSRLFGALKLDDLTRAHVEKYIAKRLTEGAHTHSIHKELVVLRGALTSAEDPGAFTAWSPNDKRELARACLRAGVPRVTPNDLRRSFATWLKQSDVDSAVVAAMMGRSSTAMVDKVYGKHDEATYRHAIGRLPGASDAAATPDGIGRAIGCRRL